MVKHADIVGFVPLLQKLEVVYAKNDGNGGFYKQPALALAVVKDETTPSVTFLVPMISMNREKEIDIAHEYNIIGYDDGSLAIDWKKVAEKFEAGKKKR